MAPDQPTDDETNPSTEQLRSLLIRHISGFEPAVTGTICDTCNAGLSEGDDVTVYAALRWDTGDGPAGGEGWTWSLDRTMCDHHDAETSDLGTNAVVECTLGPTRREGMIAPLYNPDVTKIHRDRDGEREILERHGLGGVA